jgi:hypothetical protein
MNIEQKRVLGHLLPLSLDKRGWLSPLIEIIDMAALVEFLDEAQVDKVIGFGGSCLGIFFSERS